MSTFEIENDYFRFSVAIFFIECIFAGFIKNFQWLEENISEPF